MRIRQLLVVSADETLSKCFGARSRSGEDLFCRVEWFAIHLPSPRRAASLGRRKVQGRIHKMAWIRELSMTLVGHILWTHRRGRFGDARLGGARLGGARLDDAGNCDAGRGDAERCDE